MTAIDYLRRTDVVHIATETRDGREVVTPIWAVVVDGVPYVRSGYGADSHWYRRVQRTGRAAFVEDGERYPVRIENIHDETANGRVDEAYRSKYAGSGSSLDAMVAPTARSYTMRVHPR